MDVSGSKVYPPPAVGMVCSSLPVQRATINGLKGAPICLTKLPPMNDCLFDYRRTNAGRRCHCDLVPTMLFTERRESTLMSVIIVKEETESHLLGWSTQAMPKEHSFLFSCFISTVSAGLKQSLLCLT